MKLPIAITALALCLPLTAMLASPNDSARFEEPRLDGKWFEGTIAAWQVEEDGTVSVKLLVGQEPKWFRTPANQSSTTQFELLTLHAVLALETRQASAPKEDARICGEATTERDGDSPSQAMRLVAVGHG